MGQTSCNIPVCNEDDCGDVLVAYSASGQNVFCEGEVITLNNTSTTPDFQEFEISWGDGTTDSTISDYTPKSHSYNYPNLDPCDDGTIDVYICYVGRKNCPAGQSCSTAGLFLSIKLKPKSDFTAAQQVCIGSPVAFVEQACNEETYLWNFGDGQTSTTASPSHTFSAIGSYNVCLTVDNDCGTDTHCQNISVVPPPEAAFVQTPPSGEGCNPLNISFDNQSNLAYSTTVWSIIPNDTTAWHFTDTTMTFNSTDIAVIFTQPGTYTVSLTASNVCGNDVANSTISVLPAPTLSIPSIPSQCQANFTYNPSASVTGPNTIISWQFPGGNPSSGTGATPGAVSYTSAGTYTVTASVQSTCGALSTSQTFALVDANGPTFAPEIFCLNAPNFNLDTEILDGDWSGIGVNASDIFVPSVAGAGTHSLTYTQQIGTCNVTSTLQVTVLALPIVNAGSDQTVCIENTAFNLSATPAGGIWSGGAGVNSSGLFVPQQAGVGTSSIIYSYTNSNGCSNTDNVQIIVEEVNVNITDNETTFCNTTSGAQLNATPTGGVWSGIGVQANGIFTPSSAGLGESNLIYSYINSNGCSDSDTLTVTVIEIGSINAGNDFAVCQNTAPFPLQAIEPLSGIWSGNGISGNTFNPQIASIGTNSLTYTVGIGTCLQTDNLIITVNTLPTVNVTLPNNICLQNSPLYLTASPMGGSWSGIGIIDTVNNVFSPNVAGLGTFLLSYSYTDPTTNCTSVQASSVTVYHITVNIDENETIYCNTNNVYLLNAEVMGANGGGSGTWIGLGVTENGEFNPSLIDTDVGIDTIIYTFTDGLGCTGADTLIVNVIEAEQINAGANEQLCQNEAILTLTGFSPLGGIWSGSSAISGNTFNPMLANVGNNIITYSIGSESCLVTDTRIITVLPVPDASAGNNQSICLNEGSINLNGTPIGGSWSGSNVSEQGVFTPTMAGDFLVTYQFTNTEGCTDSSSVNVYVEGIPPFSFAANDTACIGDALIFNITGGSGTSCNWDFGDGTTSGNCNVVHIYNAIGTYTITLSVETPLGCTDSVTKNIFVTAPPMAQFSHDANNATFTCTPLVVNFQNQSNTFGTEATFIYDFGNGEQLVTNNPDTLVQYTYTGNYIVSDTTFYISLTVVNPCGTAIYTDSVKVAPTPQVEFGPLVDVICSGTPVPFNNITIGNPDSFIFDWGDGTTTNTTELDTISHTFYAVENDTVFTVCLSATNNCGTDTKCWDITVHPNTVMSFFYTSNLSGCEPLTVNVQDFSTDNTLQPEWNFGDGNVAIGDSAMHTFTQPGTYTIYNYASNGCAFDTSTAVVTVFPAPIITAISIEPLACIGAEVSFGVTANVPLAGITWDFGDGTPINSDSNPTHIYQQTGAYIVIVTITSAGNQCSAIQTSSISIVARPQADFTGNLTGCSPFLFSANNTSVNASYYEWNFDDGNTSAQINPQHVFEVTENTVFTTMMVAYNDAGCADTVFHNITIYPQPIANFTALDSTFCQTPATVTLIQQSQNAVGYWWDMGNGTTFTENSIVYTYEQEGVYTISLIAENIYGCKDTAQHQILVVPQPIAIAEIPPGIACIPFGLQPINNSVDATEYLWTTNDGQIDTSFVPNFYYSTPNTYVVTLITTNHNICPDTAQVSLTVNPSPTANFTYQEIIDPIPQGLLQFEDESYDNIIKWHWNFNGQDSSSLQNPQYRFLSKNNPFATLTVTNTFGCTDDTTQILKFQLTPGLFFPNAFTPDSGIPEVRLFSPKGVCLSEYEVWIYDKWGGLLWHSDELTTDGQPKVGWDGTCKGELVQQGSYVWKARATFIDGSIWEGKEYDSKKLPTGTVTLIR